MSLRNSLNVLGGGTPELSGGESATFVNVTATSQFLAANGTPAAPGYAFTARPSDGLFSSALGALGVSTSTLQGPSYLSTTSAAGSAFTNQPSNDSVTVVSSSAADVTQVVTIIGTTTATNTVVTENITLTGTTGVVSAKVNWGQVLAVKISASCAGTMTVKKTTGALTIVAITTTNLSAGVNTVSAANSYAYIQTLSTVASGATTKQVGWQGTNSAGTVIYDSNALNGATAVASNSTFLTLTQIYTGDVEGTRTVTVTTNGGFTVQAGNVSLTATGTNQSITLTPSGTGVVSVGGTTPTVQATGANDLLIAAPSAGQNVNVTYGSHTITFNNVNNAVFPTDTNGSADIGVSTQQFRDAWINRTVLIGGTTRGTGQLQLLSTSGTSAGGITFATDTNFFRNTATDLQLARSGAIAFFLSSNASFAGISQATGFNGPGVVWNANTTYVLSGVGAAALTLDSSQNATFAQNVTLAGTALITKPGGTIPLITTNTGITSGAGAQVGTLTNSPTAGNPTSWVRINDNGTTRYIPAW